MVDYIKLSSYNDDTYGLITEFLSKDDEIIFAYTKVFNGKYTYEFVNEKINIELKGKYLKNHD